MNLGSSKGALSVKPIAILLSVFYWAIGAMAQTAPTEKVCKAATEVGATTCSKATVRSVYPNPALGTLIVEIDLPHTAVRLGCKLGTEKCIHPSPDLTYLFWGPIRNKSNDEFYELAPIDKEGNVDTGKMGVYELFRMDNNQSPPA